MKKEHYEETSDSPDVVGIRQTDFDIKEEIDQMDIGTTELHPPDIHYNLLSIKSEPSDETIGTHGFPDIIEDTNTDDESYVTPLAEEVTSVKSKIKNIQCDTCSVLFTTKVSLSRHIQKKHNSLKCFGRRKGPTSKVAFECTDCSLKFTNSYRLICHFMVIHTSEKLLECSVCREFVRNDRFKMHMTSHTGEKPFACSHCDYKTFRSDSLKQHIKRHTGEKPFACSLCEYTAVTSGELTIHVRRHTGDKPFACSQCDYKTASRGDLTKHIKRHTDDNPYECDDCNTRYKNKRGLLWHMTNRHARDKPKS